MRAVIKCLQVSFYQSQTMTTMYLTHLANNLPLEKYNKKVNVKPCRDEIQQFFSLLRHQMPDIVFRCILILCHRLVSNSASSYSNFARYTFWRSKNTPLYLGTKGNQFWSVCETKSQPLMVKYIQFQYLQNEWLL